MCYTRARVFVYREESHVLHRGRNICDHRPCLLYTSYLPKEIKAQVDEIVEQLAQLPEVAACYEQWWKPVSYTHLDVYKRQELVNYRNGSLYTRELLQEVLLGLHSLCVGADAPFFNGHTNISRCV